KLLKNGMLVGLIECLPAQQYRLIRPYPHKGNDAQKRAVVQDSLVRLPLLVSLRQFLRLGASISDALRKAAAVQRISSYDPAAFTPLLNWAQSLGALNPDVDAEELVIQAEEAKEIRHQVDATKRVVFLSHSSKDKAFIRRLATDLLSEGITVWIDEQDIKVGDSIPERIAQGVADSDFFLVALSINSIESDWVKKELNSALVDEIIRRKTKVLPVLLSKVEIPASIKDKKYADFSDNYKEGLRELLRAIKERG
ncbi:MAG TPA: toll/interleukin-1 receptor domain-containing protein, partial [Beijerinckiaceae bacterium]